MGAEPHTVVGVKRHLGAEPHTVVGVKRHLGAEPHTVVGAVSYTHLTLPTKRIV